MEKFRITAASVFRAILLVILVLILIFSLGAYFSLQSLTLLKWWIPLLIAFVISAMSGATLWRIWKKLTKISTFAVNYIAHIVFFTFFLTGLFYTLNYVFSSDTNIKKETVTVEQKFREKHYRSRRVGRRSYVRGTPYYEYYITIQFENGKEKKVELPYKTYQCVKKDMELTLRLREGLFGPYIFNTSDLPKDNDLKPVKKKGRCKFFGTSSTPDKNLRYKKILRHHSPENYNQKNEEENE